MDKISIKKDSTLKYEMADFDVCDPYTFTINSFEGDLEFQWQMDESDSGVIKTERSALMNSTTIIPFSQGNYMTPNAPGHEMESKDCPVFILSKKVFSELMDNKSSQLKITQYENEHSKLNPLEFVAIEKRNIILNGNEIQVEAVHAVIKGEKEYEADNIWILNNAECPLVIRLEMDFTGGDNYWDLKELNLN